MCFFSLILADKAISQCEGPYISGNECNSVFIKADENLFFIPIAGGYDIDIQSSAGEVYVTPGPGVRIYRDQVNNQHAANFPSSFNISGLSDGEFVSSPLFMYEMITHFGPFGEGSTGYLAFKTDDDRFGYIEIANAGTEQCSPGFYHFIINETGITEDGAENPLTGDCPSLLAAAAEVPTLGQWGLIMLSLLVFIIGAVSIKAISVNRSLN